LRQLDSQFKVPDLAELLWKALLRVESKEGYKPGDPVFIEFRRNLLRMIAELEVARSHDRADETKRA